MAEPIHPVEQAVALLEGFISNPPSESMQHRRPYAYFREVRKHAVAKAAIAALYSCNDWNFVEEANEAN